MTDRPSLAWIPLVLLTAMGAAAVTATMRFPTIPPPSTRTITVHATPDVLRAVQDLARLETVSFHMERVVDLRETQTHAWGLVEAQDAILLVAVGEVIAGVDLSGLRAGDVDHDIAVSRVTLTLPHATVFSSRLDGERTYVYRRDTDMLARRQERLETLARQDAERSIGAAAREAGILARAEANAERTLRGLVRAMGVREVVIAWR
ncbi:MAG: DUF4230 domain-containing protein [Polyangiales bacterium]